MDTASRYRRTARRQLRDAIIDVARSLTIDRGWEAVRMADVAAAVGVSRQTVYNEFTNKPGLADALAQREIDRFIAGVRNALFTRGPDGYGAVHAAVSFVLSQAAADPLIKAVLTSPRGGSDTLLPYLTTRADLVLTAAAAAAVRDWADVHLPSRPADEVAVGAEVIIRLVVSHIVLPGAPAEQVADLLAGLAQHYLTCPAPQPPPAAAG